MSYFSIFDRITDPLPTFFRGSSVYVISDSQLAEYKRAQTQAELLELDRLIEGHKQSIKQLENTREKIQAELPPSPDKPELTSSE